MPKAGAAKKGWRDTRRVDMRAKLHNKRTWLRRHNLAITDLDRQTQSSTTATGLEMHPDHRHRASEVSRASKTNSSAAEPMCHISMCACNRLIGSVTKTVVNISHGCTRVHFSYHIPSIPIDPVKHNSVSNQFIPGKLWNPNLNHCY